MVEKWTPGPWLREGLLVYALQQNGFQRGEPLMVNRFTLAVQSGYPRPPTDELEAIATLAAAAPAMAEALAALLASVGPFDARTMTQAQMDANLAARAALRLARGEP